MRVLVTGASGQLADAVLRAFADREVVAHTRAMLDVTDIDAVTRAVDQARPDAIVNCAAFNQVDAAEDRPRDAFAVNAFAVRTLARAADATRHLVDSTAAPGLYHCVNSGHATWYQVASEAARLLRVQPRLKAMTTAEAKFAAARPRFCALSNRKLAGAGFDMPAWQDALQRWFAARSPAASGVEGLAPSGVDAADARRS